MSGKKFTHTLQNDDTDFQRQVYIPEPVFMNNWSFQSGICILQYFYDNSFCDNINKGWFKWALSFLQQFALSSELL